MPDPQEKPFDPLAEGAKPAFDPLAEGAKPLSLGTATSISGPETFLHRAARLTAGELPAIGTTIGGIVGGVGGGVTTGVGAIPLAVGGAAFGAGLGESARQLIARWFPDIAKQPPSAVKGAIETVKQTALGGATEATTPILSKLFAAVAPTIRRSAARGLRAVMDPTGAQAEGEALRASEKLLDEGGFRAATRGQLESRAERKIAELSPETGKIAMMEAKVKGEEIPLKPVYDGLNALKRELHMPTVPSITGGTPGVVKYTRENQVAAIDRLIDHIKTQEMDGKFIPGKTISRESLRLIRQNIDEITGAVHAQGARLEAGALTPDMSLTQKTTKDMGNVLRTVLNKNNATIAELNAEFSLWKSVKDAMSPTSLKAEFPKEKSIWTEAWHARYGLWLASALGAGGAGYHIGSAVGGVGGGVAGAAEAVGALLAVNQLMGTTAWRTTSVAMKNRIADGLAHGAYEDVAMLATRLAISNNPAPPPEQKETPSPLLAQPPSMPIRP